MNNNQLKIKIKICGIKDFKIVDQLLKFNIDFLGLNFIENSKRYIDINTAIHISKKIKQTNKQISLVGLFQDHEKEHVNKLVEFIGLDFVQLCGNESLEYTKEIDCKSIKTIHIKPEDHMIEIDNKIKKYLLNCDYVILDTFSKKSSGGTGKTFDWDKYKELFSNNIFLAGGLNPKNINNAVRILSPWGVDVSSGVETNGIKDVNKIQSFIQQCKHQND